MEVAHVIVAPVVMLEGRVGSEVPLDRESLWRRSVGRTDGVVPKTDDPSHRTETWRRKGKGLLLGTQR